MFLITLWNFSLGYACAQLRIKDKDAASGWGCGARLGRGPQREVAVRTCQAGEERPVVFVQEGVCNAAPPKQTLAESEQ